MKVNSKTTKEQLEAIIRYQIAVFDEYCGSVEEDYYLRFYIIESETSFKIIFEWVYEIKEGEAGEFQRDSKCLTTDDYFVWLKGEDFIKLYKYVEEVLEKVTKDKVNYV
jgi:hypothetical protein